MYTHSGGQLCQLNVLHAPPLRLHILKRWQSKHYLPTCLRCLDLWPSVWIVLYKWLKGKSKSAHCVSSTPHASGYIRLPVHMLTATAAVVLALLAAAPSVNPPIRTLPHTPDLPSSHLCLTLCFYFLSSIHQLYPSPLASLSRWHCLLPTSLALSFLTPSSMGGKSPYQQHGASLHN